LKSLLCQKSEASLKLLLYNRLISMEGKTPSEICGIVRRGIGYIAILVNQVIYSKDKLNYEAKA
jgi:hypothetical protein